MKQKDTAGPKPRTANALDKAREFAFMTWLNEHRDYVRNTAPSAEQLAETAAKALKFPVTKSNVYSACRALAIDLPRSPHATELKTRRLMVEQNELVRARVAELAREIDGLVGMLAAQEARIANLEALVVKP